MVFVVPLSLVVAASYLPGALSQCTGLICDSFDTYTGSLINGKAYGPNKLNATVANVSGSPIWAEIDTTMSYSPPSSLHINLTAANSTGALLNDVPTTPWPNVYGRTMLHYSNASGNAVPDSVHSWIFNANGQNSFYLANNVPNTTAPNGGVSMNLIVKNQLCLNYHWATGEASACSKTSLIKANQWYCIQWHYDGPNNNAEVYVDGALVLSVVHNSTSTNYTPPNAAAWRFADSPGWNKMQFGFQHYQTLTSPVNLHLDDYVLDTAPTCCPCAAGVTLPHCCVTTTAPSSAPSSAPSAPSPEGTTNSAMTHNAFAAGLFGLLSLLFF